MAAHWQKLKALGWFMLSFWNDLILLMHFMALFFISVSFLVLL